MLSSLYLVVPHLLRLSLRLLPRSWHRSTFLSLGISVGVGVGVCFRSITAPNSAPFLTAAFFARLEDVVA